MSRLSSWRRDGSPWHTALPIADLAAVLRRYGYTVYIIGNDAHLANSSPEDHTPFSASGWPRPNPYPWVHACDVMPPRAGSGLPGLAALGAQISRDRREGLAAIGWLKYMNWTTAAGQCIHESWKPNYARRSSGDRGHIHLSARTDRTHAHSNYDPVARVRGKPAAPPKAPPPASAVPTYSRALAYVKGQAMPRGVDVRLWQSRMRQRGWTIGVDGIYGPQSAGVCRQFQREKGLTADGIVGERTWNATWTAPITS
jgi:Putative peptidoglycan binding domain